MFALLINSRMSAGLRSHSLATVGTCVLLLSNNDCDGPQPIAARRRLGTAMKRLIEFPLEMGGTVLAEVEVAQGSSLVPAATDAAGVAGTATRTFESALDTVKPAAASLVKKLGDLAPGAIELEFGITLSAEAGAFFAAAGTTAQFKIKLTWNNKVA
jgi:Trypsin-co-occurring domain 1